MDQQTEREKKILKELKKIPYGATQEQLAKLIGVSHPTCGKTLDIMVAKNLITMRRAGSAKLHYLPKYYKGD